MPGQRADAQRNYARILVVAEDEVAEHGANASMEQIARVAGVGSATVRRHFPTRRALLAAVFRERIAALVKRAEELQDAPDPRAALLEWLRDLMTYVSTVRGMSDALRLEDLSDGPDPAGCGEKVAEAAEPLVRRAARAKLVARGIKAADLVALVSGIALATEHAADPEGEGQRLLGIAVRGVSPRR